MRERLRATSMYVARTAIAVVAIATAGAGTAR
jgi:hypothetical protein